MKRKYGKKPFQNSIRNDVLFSNDILKIFSEEHEELTLTWELTEASLAAAEAVLFEDIKDVEKQIWLMCIKDGQTKVRTIHTGAFKGEVTVSPALGDAFYKAEYRIYNSLNISLTALASDRFYLKKNRVKSNERFFIQDKRHDWTDQFSAYTGYSLKEGKGPASS
ncbi:hypothetical protein P9D34_12065 [Bacillus swezeyi]|uniref:Uncharacterized protein n=1 Tax=Bacillus swezeyi TaxID=1925020 RepID=A0A1R1QAN7_9BACI|nr:hypothetical protein [Bacillus swezeyi]MEC1261178.1 hypothetical protein [Bacillus swezeyi]MED1739749.1 hypothetical protein [Bacillus swezeyi]MED2929351.1 hypothetical protein [Bacillus swezeyi]MED2941163.1 hypothetical protein [Bacillus swezeyi]MED2963622.1 hypothetical protein [Bacillus swezeyi]